MDRTKIGIVGMDELMDGGIPLKSSVLVFGKAGSGKSIFALSYIYNGAKMFNEPGLYISFEQDLEAIYQQCSTFGWNIKDLEKKGKIKIISLKIDEINRDIANNILYEANKINAKRLAIDNLEFLALNPIFLDNQNFSILSGEKVIVAHNPKQFIYNLVHILNLAQTTTLYLTSSGDVSYTTKDGISEYVCDGLINLRTVSIGKAFLRTVEIIKMRKTGIKGGIYNFEINDMGMRVIE